MLKHLLAALLLLISTQLLQAQDAWWEWQNPKPQGSNLRDVAMIDSNTYIAVGEGGLVIKTTDDGATWDIKILPTSSIPFTAIAMSPDKLHGVIIGENGISYSTTDQGKTWNRVIQELSTRFRDACYSSDLVAHAVGMFGLSYRSTNGGTTWITQAFDSVDNLWGVHFSDAQRGFISASYGIYYVTTDGGTAWERKQFPFANTLFSVHSTDGVHGITAGEAGGVFLSNNGGASWQQQDIPTPHIIRSAVRLSKDRAVFCGDRFTLYCTTNGGLTWENKRTDFRTEHLKGLSFAGQLHGVCVGANGIILRTNDGGVTWHSVFEKVAESQTLRGVFCFDDVTAVAVGSAIVRTKDGGKKWTDIDAPTTSVLRAVHFPEKNIGYAVGDSGTVLKSTDQGLSWSRLQTPFSSHLVGVHFLDANKGVAIGTEQEIIVTSDGGTSWAITRIALAYEFTAVAYLSPTSVLVVGNDRTDPSFSFDYTVFYHSSDQGKTWTELPERIQNLLSTSVSFADSLNGFIAGMRGGNAAGSAGQPLVASTTDGGHTWKWGAIDVVVHAPLNAVSAADRLRATAAGGNGYSIHTTDGGATWKRVETNTRSTIWALDHPNQRTATAVGYRSMILRMTTIDPPLAVENPVASSSNYFVRSIYPNPAITGTTFLFDVQSPAVVTFDLFTTEGKQLRTLYKGLVATGEHRLEMDLRELASGTYIVAAGNGTATEYHRLVIAK